MDTKKSPKPKAFGLWGAVFLGIGSMVGAGIFIVIGEAGVIAGNLVTVSFVIGGMIALLSGYSLSKLAVRYPSRGGIIEYLTQCYGEGLFSGTLGVLFYLAQLVALAAIAKSFGTYAATYMHGGVTHLNANLFAVSVLASFVLINLAGADIVAKAENIIVLVKLTALAAFTAIALFYIQPSHLMLDKSPEIITIFYALGLTFFAYQGFSVITNCVEDMQDPKHTMLRSMFWAIGLVGILYLCVSIAVFGNLSLDAILRDKDFALAAAAKPAFGAWGFKIMAATALLATASAINAALYGVTQVSFTLAVKGDLPKEYKYNIFHNTQGLVISALLVVPMMLFFNLGQIAAIAALAVLLIQGFTHVGHLFKHKETGGNFWLILMASFGTIGAAWFALAYTSKSMPHIVYYILGIVFLALVFEVLLQWLNGRTIHKQTPLRSHQSIGGK
jgi:amino acid transporter